MRINSAARTLCAYPLAPQRTRGQVFVSPRTSEGPTRFGNRYSVYLGQEMTPGLLAPISKSKASPKRTYATKPEKVRKICPGCAVELPVTRRCVDCWKD